MKSGASHRTPKYGLYVSRATQIPVLQSASSALHTGNIFEKKKILVALCDRLLRAHGYQCSVVDWLVRNLS
jgi:hypothetical protein